MSNSRMGVFLSAALLSACGGGGGDGSPHSTATSTTFPLQAAYQSYAQSSQSYSFGLSGTCGGSATAINSPMTAAAPGGSAAFVKTSVVQMKIDSCSTNVAGLKSALPNPGTTVATVQFGYDANRRPVSISIPGVGTLGVSSGVLIPATVKVGDAAVLASGPALTVSYSVEADAENSAFLHLNFQGHDASGASVATEVQTFRISTAGDFTLVRDETFMPNGFSFVLAP
jgi:hypothetical protein